MTINCNGALIDVSKPKIMGILNITPDSFYDGGKLKTDLDVINQTRKMLLDGATFIDIGAASSKPNANEVSLNEELKRIVPVVGLLLKEFPDTILSIDTYRSEVAKICIENGAAIINDISAGNLDFKMLEIVAKLDVPYIMMHLKGTPQSMQSLANYEDLMKEILFYFSEKINVANQLGIKDVIIDPGFGFAKTINHNFELLQKLNLLALLEKPILAGLSRKSMVYKTLDTTTEMALNGTTVLNTIALQNGANILRVHDVKEAMEVVKLVEKLKVLKS